MPRLNNPVFAALLLIPILSGCTAPEPTEPPVTPTAAATATQPPTATMAVTPTATPIPEQIADAHGAEMILIPEGAFTMGSDLGFPDELPIHQVTLDGFYMDK